MEFAENDWTKFRRRISIKASKKAIYRAWVIPKNLERWFLEKVEYKNSAGEKREGEIQSGDLYSWKWNGWETIHHGKIIEANGSDLIKFDFGESGIVTVSIIEETSETNQLVLMQEDIPDDETSKKNFYCGCNLGWSFWLVNLKAFLEHGITLHNKKPTIGNYRHHEHINC